MRRSVPRVVAGFCALALVLAYSQSPAEARWRSFTDLAIFVDDEPSVLDGSPPEVCERGITLIVANDFIFDDSSPPSGASDDRYDLFAVIPGGTRVIERLNLDLPVNQITDDSGNTRWYSREYALRWTRDLAPGTQVTLTFDSAQEDFSEVLTVGNCPGNWASRSVDFRPGTTDKALDCRSTALLPVAVLSRSGFGVSFDATSVLADTVRFGPRGIEAAPVSSSNTDVNGDGRPDKLLNFRPGDTGCRRGTTTVQLIGGTNDSFTFYGSAPVTTTNCPK